MFYEIKVDGETVKSFKTRHVAINYAAKLRCQGLAADVFENFGRTIVNVDWSGY